MVSHTLPIVSSAGVTNHLQPVSCGPDAWDPSKKIFHDRVLGDKRHLMEAGNGVDLPVMAFLLDFDDEACRGGQAAATPSVYLSPWLVAASGDADLVEAVFDDSSNEIRIFGGSQVVMARASQKLLPDAFSTTTFGGCDPAAVARLRIVAVFALQDGRAHLHVASLRQNTAERPYAWDLSNGWLTRVS